MPKLKATRYRIVGPQGETVGEITARGKAQALEAFKSFIPRARHKGLTVEELHKL